MLFYTESVFLFLTMYSFYLLKRKKYGVLLGIVLGLSVATRNSGSLLFFAIFIFMFFLLVKKEIKLISIIKTYIPATIISCLYPLYLQIHFGNWKIFMDCQYTDWQKIKTNIFSTLGYQYRVIFLGESGCRPYWLVKYVHAFNEMLTITLTIFIIYLIFKEIKKIRKNRKLIQPNIVLILYLAFSLICFNSTIKMIEYDTPTISFYRYYLALFPIYLLLDNLNIKTRKIITIMMLILSIIIVFFFSTGNFFY